MKFDIYGSPEKDETCDLLFVSLPGFPTISVVSQKNVVGNSKKIIFLNLS